MRARIERSEIIKHAVLEYRVTRQTSTGNGDLYCAQWKPAPGFIGHELGFKSGEGPSIEYTLLLKAATVRAKGHTPQENQARLAPYEAPEAPVKQKRRKNETRASRKAKRENKWKRYEAFQETERNALAMR